MCVCVCVCVKKPPPACWVHALALSLSPFPCSYGIKQPLTRRRRFQGPTDFAPVYLINRPK